MPYFLEYLPRAHYELREVRLTRMGRNTLFAGIAMNLKCISDEYRSDAANRVPDAPGHFNYTHIMRDEGRVHTISFTVDDTCAKSGVLRVVSVDELLADR